MIPNTITNYNKLNITVKFSILQICMVILKVGFYHFDEEMSIIHELTLCKPLFLQQREPAMLKGRYAH